MRQRASEGSQSHPTNRYRVRSTFSKTQRASPTPSDRLTGTPTTSDTTEMNPPASLLAQIVLDEALRHFHSQMGHFHPQMGIKGRTGQFMAPYPTKMTIPEVKIHVDYFHTYIGKRRATQEKVQEALNLLVSDSRAHHTVTPDGVHEYEATAKATSDLGQPPPRSCSKSPENDNSVKHESDLPPLLVLGRVPKPQVKTEPTRATTSPSDTALVSGDSPKSRSDRTAER